MILVSCAGTPSQQTDIPQTEISSDQVAVEEAGSDSEATHEEDLSLVLSPETEALPVSSFGEVWAYVSSERERFVKPNLPISDIGYHSAAVNLYGELEGVPNPKNIPNFSGRIHLVVQCDGRALSHFVLIDGPVRRKLITDLLEASKAFDGLQIDFENVPARDGDNFRSFLAELKKGLGNKLFSIAISARTRTLDNDVYDYSKIKNIVDKVLVMAYDEHWSTSAPGPVASMDWCNSVASYALRTIGSEKLIMGIPFYGRSWGNWTSNKAFTFLDIQDLKAEHNVTDIQREKGVPTFIFEAPMKVTVYYDDDYSISTRMEMYRTMGVRSIGFWRLGQASPTIWSRIALSKNEIRNTEKTRTAD
jgi:spore germination protein YaaH